MRKRLLKLYKFSLSGLLVVLKLLRFLQAVSFLGPYIYYVGGIYGGQQGPNSTLKTLSVHWPTFSCCRFLVSVIVYYICEANITQMTRTRSVTFFSPQLLLEKFLLLLLPSFFSVFESLWFRGRKWNWHQTATDEICCLTGPAGGRRPHG